MRTLFTLALCATLFATAPAGAAAEPCPPREPGTYPWATYGTVPGDEWAWVYLELDKKGWPKRCLMGENNIDDSDRRFFVCRAMQQDWRPASKEDGERLASTTVKRFFVIPGPDHEKKMREARKRYFAEHPSQRPDCYPEG